MLAFWICSAVLLLLACLLVVVPLWQEKRAQADALIADQAQRKAQNIRIFKERIAELEDELRQEKLDQNSFDEQTLELETTLLSDVNTDTLALEAKYGSSNSSKSRVSALVLIVLVGASAYGLYFKYGSYEGQQQFLAMKFAPQELQQAKKAADEGDVASLLEQLHQKLKTSPDNIDGWMLLARSAMNIENYALAAEAYSNVANSLEAQQHDAGKVYGLLAQAFYFADRGVLTERVQSALDRAFKSDPNESNALGLLAINAFENRRYQEAAALWQRLLQSNPEHPAKASIEAGIARAKGYAGLEGEVTPASVSNSAVAEKSLSPNEQGAIASSKVSAKPVAEISVSVELADAFLQTVQPGDSVFIFARSEQGPPMPLAVSRHTVAELPLTVTLNDDSAMGPMAKLSQVKQVNITARVSTSGEPLAQAGDLQGWVESVPVFDAAQIRLVIDQTL